LVKSVSNNGCIHRCQVWLKAGHDQGSRSAIADVLQNFSLVTFAHLQTAAISLSNGFPQRDHRLMEEDRAKDRHRIITTNGASSASAPAASLPSRKRSPERIPSPPRGWRRGDAPWHLNSRREIAEQQMPAGPRPFLPAAGPRPFLSASVLLGRPDPATMEAQQEPAQVPPVMATARQALPPPGSIEQALTRTDLQTNTAIHDLQADCPLCNCLTLQRGNQRRCMLFPGCPFNWRVGWTPYW
jgi:hypothetical protein